MKLPKSIIVLALVGVAVAMLTSSSHSQNRTRGKAEVVILHGETVYSQAGGITTAEDIFVTASSSSTGAPRYAGWSYGGPNTNITSMSQALADLDDASFDIIHISNDGRDVMLRRR